MSTVLYLLVLALAQAIPVEHIGAIADMMLNLGYKGLRAEREPINKPHPKKANGSKAHPHGREEKLLQVRKDRGEYSRHMRGEWSVPKSDPLYWRQVEYHHAYDTEDALDGYFHPEECASLAEQFEAEENEYLFAEEKAKAEEIASNYNLRERAAHIMQVCISVNFDGYWDLPRSVRIPIAEDINEWNNAVLLIKSVFYHMQ